MTRFWIDLEKGVEFVLSSLEDMRGGELYIPKIPSMRVLDFINNICPNKKIVEGILILGGCFLVTIFARCMCYKKRSNEDYLLADNNEIRFYTEDDRI